MFFFLPNLLNPKSDLKRVAPIKCTIAMRTKMSRLNLTSSKSSSVTNGLALPLKGVDRRRRFSLLEQSYRTPAPRSVTGGRKCKDPIAEQQDGVRVSMCVCESAQVWVSVCVTALTCMGDCVRV